MCQLAEQLPNNPKSMTVRLKEEADLRPIAVRISGNRGSRLEWLPLHRFVPLKHVYVLKLPKYEGVNRGFSRVFRVALTSYCSLSNTLFGLKSSDATYFYSEVCSNLKGWVSRETLQNTAWGDGTQLCKNIYDFLTHMVQWYTIFSMEPSTTKLWSVITS